MTVNILGTDYEIVKDTYSANTEFGERGIGAYIEFYRKRIVYCDMSTYKGWEDNDGVTIREAEKSAIRHEIVHGFLYESGLNDNSSHCSDGWAINEEMVDWFAINGPKIYKAWQQAGCV